MCAQVVGGDDDDDDEECEIVFACAIVFRESSRARTKRFALIQCVSARAALMRLDRHDVSMCCLFATTKTLATFRVLNKDLSSQCVVGDARISVADVSARVRAANVADHILIVRYDDSICVRARCHQRYTFLITRSSLFRARPANRESPSSHHLLLSTRFVRVRQLAGAFVTCWTRSRGSAR